MVLTFELNNRPTVTTRISEDSMDILEITKMILDSGIMSVRSIYLEGDDFEHVIIPWEFMIGPDDFTVSMVSWADLAQTLQKNKARITSCKRLEGDIKINSLCKEAGLTWTYSMDTEPYLGVLSGFKNGGAVGFRSDAWEEIGLYFEEIEEYWGLLEQIDEILEEV